MPRTGQLAFLAALLVSHGAGARQLMGPFIVTPGALTAAGGLTTTGDAGNTTVLGRTQSARAADVVRVADYGAVCDGALHLLSGQFGTLAAAQAVYPAATALTQDSDWAAMTAATNGARAATNGSVLVFPAGKVCVVGTTWNVTGIQKTGFAVDGAGATILGKTTGTPVIDGLGLRYSRWRDLTVTGDATAVPSIGMQIGRTNTTALNSSDNQSFEDVFFNGSYSFATFYNLNSETTKFDHVFFWNNYAGTGFANSYTLVMDGLNHWAASSAYITESQPVDTPQSFNENVFLNCDFRHSGGGNPIWTAQTARHKYISSYAATAGGHYGMVLYSRSNTDSNNMLSIDMHFETTSLTDDFLLTGPNAAPLLYGFEYRDHQSFASNSVFKADTGVTTPAMRGARIDVGGLQAGSRMFDVPSAWAVTGVVSVPSTGMWNLDRFTFSGELDVGGVKTANYQGSVYGSSIYLPNGFAAGTDAANGNATLGTPSGAGTPYIDFYGNGLAGRSARITSQSANQLQLSVSGGAMTIAPTQVYVSLPIYSTGSVVSATLTEAPTLQFGSSSGPTIATGTVVPLATTTDGVTGHTAGTPAAGSKYVNSTGAAGARVYWYFSGWVAQTSP